MLRPDIYIPALGLITEVDGRSHERCDGEYIYQQRSDELRDHRYRQKLGLWVFVIQNYVAHNNYQLGMFIEGVDLHFTLACAHSQLMSDSASIDVRRFHESRMRAHLVEMKNLIRRFGSFESIEDPSGRSLHQPDSWTGSSLPDPNMFNIMPHSGFQPGDELPADFYLPILSQANLTVSSCRRVQ